jgi:hypothetical protein
MVRGLRKKVIGLSDFARCGICHCIDRSVYFDVDHKIPQSAGGTDDLWNLWPLCLKHHRQKCLAEIDWIRTLNQFEYRCFSCNNVFSSFFHSGFWCLGCSKLSQEDLTQNLENIIKNLNVEYNF